MNGFKDTKEYLNHYRIKPSVQRMAIMNFLWINRIHPTVDDIYNALTDDIPTLSRTTVYNTLKLFVDSGAVLMLSIDEKNTRYDIDISAHAHFRCLGCDCIYDIPIENREHIYIDGIGALKVTETHLYYRGYCEACLKKESK